MKKITVNIIFLICAAYSANSQTILTQSNNPAIGDVRYFVRTDTTGIHPGNSGANQTWNFTSLVRRDSSALLWISPAGTPHASSFPNSNICAHDTCYNYYNGSGNKFEYQGYDSHDNVAVYSNFQNVLTYPFGYNSSFTDSFAADIPDQGGTIYRRGTVTSTGDAWGTINLPFGSYQNALRVKHVITLNDSIAGSFSLLTTYTIYEWFVPGKKFAVFNIVYTSISFFDGFISFKNAGYNPGSTPIGIVPVSNEIPQSFKLYQNYPNPFNPTAKIKFELPNSSFTSMKVFDLLGREVLQPVDMDLKAGIYEVSLDMHGFSSGTYFYRLTAGNFSETKKMLIIK